MPILTAAYQAEVKAWLASFPSSQEPPPFYLAGHSMGCRVAIQVALLNGDCQGLILFSYPLIGAGKNKEPRLAGLEQISSRSLSISGNRDALCPTDLWQKILQDLPLFTLHVLNHGDHSLAVPAKIKPASGQDLFEAEVIQALRQFKEP